MNTNEDTNGFRERLLSGQMLLGTFLKTPTPHATEIFGGLGFDFVVIDDEHAPFDRSMIDHILLAAKAVGIAGLVRVSSVSQTEILSAFDCGATGVLVPHVSSAPIAREIVAASRYRAGKRGFSNSTRAGGYGRTGIKEHIAVSDAESVVIAMIEDPAALEEIDAIAAVEGIDAFFIGRGDLTVAMGLDDIDAVAVRDAVIRIAGAARVGNKAVFVMVGHPREADWLRALGVTGFIVSSDQGLMRQAAREVRNAFSCNSHERRHGGD